MQKYTMHNYKQNIHIGDVKSIKSKRRAVNGEDEVQEICEGANYVLIDSTLNTGLFNGGDKTFTFDYSTNVASKDKKLTFTATDTKGLVADFVVTIKPTATSIKTGVVVTSEAKLLGGQANTNGSLYSVFLDQVIKLGDGAGVSSSIDLVYYYGSTNLATLAAPSATATQSVYSKIATWSTKNATKFAKLSGVSFSEITTEAAFNTAYGTAPTATEATALTPGDVLSVVTAKGQKAIVKVSSISPTSTSGAMTILVKTVTE